MKPKVQMLWALLGFWSSNVLAQLPPPTPQEVAKKKEAAQKKARDEATAKAALGRAQNRVVERYHASYPPPVPKKPAKTGEQEAMPELDAEIGE